MTLSFPDGRTERATMKAGRLCFDSQGGGVHEQVTIGSLGRWTCKAPVTAKVLAQRNAGHQPARRLVRRQPPTRWAATQLTCHRANDQMALWRRRRQERPRSGRVPPRTLAFISLPIHMGRLSSSATTEGS